MKGFSASCQMVTIGKPLPNGDQLVPPLVVTNGPMSVPTYNVLGLLGSTTIEFTGTSGKLLVIFVHA